MAFRYLDDFHVGEALMLGSYTMDRDEILDFGRRFDPQPFHADEEAAKKTHFGGLIASGWHTVAVLMRLMVEGYIRDSASMGSPGVDEVRWLRPVRPGDVLTARGTVQEVVPSRSKTDRGHIVTYYEVFNQKDELVMSLHGRGIFGRKPENAQ